MTIAILFIVVFMTLILCQIAVVDYSRFSRSYTLPSVWFHMPSQAQIPWLQQLWEAKKNN